MTKTKKQRDWLTPLSIPEGKVGEYAIEHFTIPKGEKVMLNNMRNILLGKQKGVHSLVYDADTHWHRLTGPTGTWMTDLPVEQRQMEECLKGMRGRVLVGGLGLGLAAHLLAQKKQVKSVTVIEISQEVIRLVASTLESRHYPEANKIQVLRFDLFDYLKDYSQKPFDHAFFDIWQSDGEGTFFEVVCPLLSSSKGKVKHPPVCWNVDNMRGQLLHGLTSRLLFMSPEVREKFPQQTALMLKHPPWEMGDDIWTRWAVPFWRWWKEAQPDNDKAQAMAQIYANLYGTWDWEETWETLSRSQM